MLPSLRTPRRGKCPPFPGGGQYSIVHVPCRSTPPYAPYEGPPVNKSPGVNKPPPGGPPGGPEESGERYQNFEEIVGALRAQIFQSELMHIRFQWILEVFASEAAKSG